MAMAKMEKMAKTAMAMVIKTKEVRVISGKINRMLFIIRTSLTHIGN